MDVEESEIALDFPEEVEFHGFIRKHLICVLLFLLLYLISFYLIRFFKTRADNDELYAGDEDFSVYRISVWMCSCALAVAMGAVTLLPFSVLGSEVLHAYPDNYYLKWLNWSLINSLWNYVFALSNVSLFCLLPFAYFFIESQGFRGIQTKPILARVYETVFVCALFIVLLLGIVDVFYSLVLSQQPSFFSFLSGSLWSNIALIYSFVSLVGVFLLLLSAPFGFAKMFDVFSGLLISPTPSHFDRAAFAAAERLQTMSCVRQGGRPWPTTTVLHGYSANGDHRSGMNGLGDTPMLLDRGPQQARLQAMRRYMAILNALKYPLIMLLLVLLTGVSVSMVMINTLQLLFGFRALDYVACVEAHSRHAFGIPGAMVEVVIIVYIMVASLVGVYSIPLLRQLRPLRRKTSMTYIILNCATVLLLSSALPVLARTLGITSFDLLGLYGRIEWISNFSLVWSYNVLFAASLIFCLVNKFTAPVRREILKRLALTRRSSLADHPNLKLD